VLTALLPFAVLSPGLMVWAVEGAWLATTGSRPELCSYWGVFPPMVRRNDPEPMRFGWHRVP
jgi:hypothetical protein